MLKGGIFDTKEFRMIKFFSVFVCLISFLPLFSQQEVRIGKYVLSTSDLAVTNFNNGDPIPIVQTPQEANSYALKGKPACMKVGSSVWYNWYAVNDPRGIAPSGWHVPNEYELMNLIDVCRSNIAWVSEKNNRTILPGTPTRVEDLEPEFHWWAFGENKEFHDPFVQQLKCPFAMGPLTLEIANKTDFYPVRVFANNPSQMFAREYFLKTRSFEVNTGNNSWKLVVKSENCDSDSDEENSCYGKATLYLKNTIDTLEQYTIQLDDFSFYKKGAEISFNLGVRFDDYNFDGQLDFGIGFNVNPLEFTPQVFFLDKVKKKAVFNKEFNQLFLLGESSFFDAQKRTFEGFTTMADSYTFIEYYLCPPDSLSKFAKYKLPNELSELKVNYPNVYLVNYFSVSDHQLERFNLQTHGYEYYLLDDWGYGEMHAVEGGEPYWVELSNGIGVEVQKIDSANYENAARNVQENPFMTSIENEDHERYFLKRYGKSVKRKGNNLVLKPEEGPAIEFQNIDSLQHFYTYYGVTEDQKCWIVRQSGASEAYVQYIINCATGTIDSSMFSFPRFSPDGLHCAEGDFGAMERMGRFILYSRRNGKWVSIADVTFENLEFTFAPYDFFWIDEKTIFVKQLILESNPESEGHFEYAKFTFNFKETD